jgi:hypothetical protein
MCRWFTCRADCPGRLEEGRMTIQEIKRQVTTHDLATKSVWINTTLTDLPIRLIAIGKKFLTTLNNAGIVRKVDPIVITGVVQ